MVRMLTTVDLHSHTPAAAGTFPLADQFTKMYAGTVPDLLTRFDFAKSQRRGLLPHIANATNVRPHSLINGVHCRMSAKKDAGLVR